MATLDTRVINQSRGMEIARNVRPNGDVGLSASAVPAGGQVTVDSGIGFPAPPPRDSLTVTVTIRMTDGREASASAALVVVIRLVRNATSARFFRLHGRSRRCHSLPKWRAQPPPCVGSTRPG